MKYRSEVDGLRAVAVVPVILFHAGVEVFGGGFIGVDVFFVISGYLITSIILKDLELNRFSLTGFYERRARRILPVLFVVVAFCTVAAWFFFRPSDLKDFSQSVFAVATFSSNILFWRESGYFSAAAELKPLLHTWSLAVEEQYYILFPLILMGLWRFGRAAVLSVMVVLFIASLLLAQWVVSHSPSMAFYLLPTRAWELLLGAFTAFVLQRHQTADLPLSLLQFGSLLGLGMVVGSIFLIDRTFPFPGFYAAIPTVGVMLILLCAVPGTWVQGVLSHKWLIGIGLISYSAYLWHHPLFAFARYNSHHPFSPALMTTLIFMTFALAYISWRFVERPFRARGRFSQRQIFTFSGTGITLFLSMGLIGHFLEGVPQRLDPRQLAVLKTMQTSPFRASCHTRENAPGSLDQTCRYFSDTPNWAIVGDSHVVELAYALARVLDQQKDGLQHYSRSNCPPRYGLNKMDACSIWTDHAVEEILATESLENVVVSYRIALATHGDHHGVYPALPDVKTDAERAEVWQAYGRILEVLVAGGKRVFLVVQAPEVHTDVARLTRQLHDSSKAGDVEGVPRTWWKARMSYVQGRIADLHPEVEIIDPKEHFCDNFSCYAIRNGKALYFDDNHMSVAGATVIAREILARAR